MKKLICFICLCLTTISLSSPLYATSTDKEFTLSINGGLIETDVSPIIIDSSSELMFPLRSVLEALGYQIDWNESGIASFTVEGTNYALDITTYSIGVNGVSESCNSQLIMKNNRILISQSLLKRLLDYELRYTIKKGDTYSSISKEFYGVYTMENVDKIIDANNLSISTIQMGKELVIPMKVEFNIDYNSYTVNIIS